jgi:hypothetical protein
MKKLLFLLIFLLSSCVPYENPKFKNGDIVYVKMDDRQGMIINTYLHHGDEHSTADVRFALPDKASIIATDTAAAGSISGSSHYPPSLYIVETFNFFELEKVPSDGQLSNGH